MTRVALYARFSTDKQRETSIDDQLRAALARAEHQGWSIVATYTDEGISGSVPVAMRAGGKQLLAGMLAGRFDVLVVEGLDRLSRDLGEQEQLVKRLEHRNIRIIGTADGYDTETRGRKVMRIARGLVNELYLDDLREKTHRGLAGQFDRGMSAGGKSYGYTTEQVPGGRRLVIDQVQSAVVLEIFQKVADGVPIRQIVHELNTRGVPSPRSGTWASSALVGTSKKGLGLLNNELYIGRVIWNRRKWLKDPDTGNRRYVENPREEWQVRIDESLRIVPPDLWQATRCRPNFGPTRGMRTGRGEVPKTLFGGLVRCHACGGPVVAVNATRYGCSVRNARGDAVCSSALTVRREVLDRRLVAELRDDLLSPEAQAEVQSAARAWLAAYRRGAGGDAEALRRRLHAIQAEIARLVDAIATVGISDALAGRLKAAESERDDLERRLAAGGVQTPTQVSLADINARWRRKLLQVEQALQEHADRGQTRQLLADILGPMVLGRDADGSTYVEFEEPAERLLLAAVGESTGLVAGARFELATFGL